MELEQASCRRGPVVAGAVALIVHAFTLVKRQPDWLRYCQYVHSEASLVDKIRILWNICRRVRHSTPGLTEQGCLRHLTPSKISQARSTRESILGDVEKHQTLRHRSHGMTNKTHDHVSSWPRTLQWSGLVDSKMLLDSPHSLE
jgi:hypothetical protein